jgi:hypothetical protein
MPEAVMVIVGGPDGGEAGTGAVGIEAAGGVGDVGAGDDESPEHAVNDVSERRIRKRIGIIICPPKRSKPKPRRRIDAGGATGQVEPITRSD